MELSSATAQSIPNSSNASTASVLELGRHGFTSITSCCLPFVLSNENTPFLGVSCSFFCFVFLLMGVGVRADLCYSWPNQTSAVEGKGAVKSRSLIHISSWWLPCVAKQTAQNTYNGSECTQSSILATSLALATAVALMGAADLTGIAHPRCKLSLSAGKSRSLPISQAAASKLRFFFNRIVNCFGLAVRN